MTKKANRQALPFLNLVSSRNDFEVKYKCVACEEPCSEHFSLCPHCGAEQTVIEDEEFLDPLKGKKRPKRASEIPYRAPIFHSTGQAHWDEVLGGGAVRPSSILVHGKKGTGKSSSVLKIALKLAERLRGYILWGSAEMPETLVRQYADRMGATSRDLHRLLICDGNSAEDFLDNIDEFQPKVVVWDSIQRYMWKGELGEIEQTNVVASALQAGKDARAVSFLLSQVTKDGDYLGSSGMGHDVDVIVNMQRDGQSIVYSCDEKNRFATTPRAAREALPPLRDPSTETIP